MAKILINSAEASVADIEQLNTITICLSETEIQPENWVEQLSDSSKVNIQCVVNGPITTNLGELLTHLNESLNLNAVELDFTHSDGEFNIEDLELLCFPLDAIATLPCISLTIRGLKGSQSEYFQRGKGKIQDFKKLFPVTVKSKKKMISDYGARAQL